MRLSDVGLDGLMLARSIEEALEAIGSALIVSLNFVVGDVNGVAPIRLRGDGMAPFPVEDGEDNWGGRIPAVEMPGEIAPARGWTGSANHMTAPRDYPYTYTTNIYARELAPIFAAALAEADDPARRALGEQLAAWDHRDEADAETYWWFSDAAIRANARATLTLKPKRR